MLEKSLFTTIIEYLIFAGLGYFVYASHGWALGVSIGLLGILLLGLGNVTRDIINRLSILYDKI